jgi:glycosyltransferase involved in cell wall biosynthesis
MKSTIYSDFPTLNKSCKICLNMIVKDESPIIERVLNSVKDIISYYIIVDTGSTDNTTDLILSIMEKNQIPGEIHFHEWENFGKNRNDALKLVTESKQWDWVFFIDADEELIISNLEAFDQLQENTSYYLNKNLNHLQYQLPCLISIKNTTWKWNSPVHEFLSHESGPLIYLDFSGAYIKCYSGEGNRSIGKTDREIFLADAELLEKDRRNPRNCFYLAQSYRDADELEKAFLAYTERTTLGGWSEEIYISYLELGRIAILLNFDYFKVIYQFLQAFEINPNRSEALYSLAYFCRIKGRPSDAYIYAKLASEIPYPDSNSLFIENDVYMWRALDELSIALYRIGKTKEAIQIVERILNEKLYNEREFSRLEQNLNEMIESLKPPVEEEKLDNPISNFLKTNNLQELLSNISTMTETDKKEAMEFFENLIGKKK